MLLFWQLLSIVLKHEDCDMLRYNSFKHLGVLVACDFS